MGQGNLTLQGGSMKKILFASPFILERKGNEDQVYPAHKKTQDFIEALRSTGYQVLSVSNQAEFSACVQYFHLDLIVIMNFDGDWLMDTINSVGPGMIVHYFAEIVGHKSKHVIQHILPEKPDELIKVITEILPI
jgi:hypothetical protein